MQRFYTLSSTHPHIRPTTSPGDPPPAQQPIACIHQPPSDSPLKSMTNSTYHAHLRSIQCFTNQCHLNTGQPCTCPLPARRSPSSALPCSTFHLPAWSAWAFSPWNCWFSSFVEFHLPSVNSSVMILLVADLLVLAHTQSLEEPLQWSPATTARQQLAA